MDYASCPFCLFEPGRAILAENELAVAFFDRYPVSPGHLLITPRRHVEDYFDLTAAEKEACWALVDQARQQLLEISSPVPDGFNIGINSGEVAGQTVFHAHIHLIPRFRGDSENPRGGVRGVIEGKGDYGTGEIPLD